MAHRSTYGAASCFPVLSIALLVGLPTSASAATFSDKGQFLAQTGATSASGALPNIGMAGAVVTLDSVTLDSNVNTTCSGCSIYVGPDWTDLLPGNEIAINGDESFDVTTASPVNAFGFDFVEPSTPAGCNTTCVDSTFSVTLKRGATTVDSFTFNAPDDTAAFAGVKSDTTFDKIEIREFAGGIDNEYFGQFYSGASADQVETPGPPGDPSPPPPAPGRTVNVAPAEGIVTVQCRRDKKFAKLESVESIGIGCIVDTRRGTVVLTSSKGKDEGSQSARFWGGVFRVGQKRGNAEVTLTLVGKLNCAKRRRARRSTPTAELSRKRGRRLWGRGKGRFRTIGAHGSAGVRGTTWLVADRCDDSTLFRVKRGVVTVRDFAKNKTLTLRKDQRYIANRRERR